MYAFAPNGRPITHICELVPATYSLRSDGWGHNAAGELTFDYRGDESEIDWDSAEPQIQGGQMVFLDDEGAVWLESQIELKDDDPS